MTSTQATQGRIGTGMPNPPPPHRPNRGIAAAILLAAAAAQPAAVAGGDEAPPPAAPPASTPPASPPSAPTTAPEAAAGERVIVHIDQFTTLRGHVEFEDQQSIFVRAIDGTVERLAKDGVIAIVRLVDPRPGQPGLVVLRSGEVRAGTIVEDAWERVVIEIEGIRTTYERDVVDHVVLEPTVEERYAQFKAGLDPQVAQRHLTLCRWLVDERRYDLADVELTELTARHDLPEAVELHRLVRAQLALGEPRTTNGGGGTRRPDDETADLLSIEDVNLIRVYEINFRNPPKVAIAPRTIQMLLTDYGTSKLLPSDPESRTALYKAEPLDVVRLLFAIKARNLYSGVTVLSEPYALNLFRQRVHNAWLMNNCATSRCHGGPAAGRLRLYRRNYKSARVRYTNLLILERLEVHPDRPLVDYESPLDSLIIQYGLPPGHARYPHPPARGWRPAFRRLDDRMVRRAVDWMHSMMKPRVDYPIEFEPPVPAAGDGEGDR